VDDADPDPGSVVFGPCDVGGRRGEDIVGAHPLHASPSAPRGGRSPATHRRCGP
jgi:hypothetical protein